MEIDIADPPNCGIFHDFFMASLKNTFLLNLVKIHSYLMPPTFKVTLLFVSLDFLITFKND